MTNSICIFPQNLLQNINIEELNDIYNDELSELMSKHDSDKGFGLCKDFINDIRKTPPNGVCHNYTLFYTQLFSKYRYEELILFEMGVGVPSCMNSWAGSLLGWKEYFTNTKIFSADFDKDYLYNDDVIKSFYVDQENEQSIKELWLNLKEYNFDIIVDDGPHTFSSNILFYKESIQKLKTNGIYIIEDINLDFIDNLFDEIKIYNENNNINFNIVKLIIPYPKKFTHIFENILKMNNLLIIQKL